MIEQFDHVALAYRRQQHNLAAAKSESAAPSVSTTSIQWLDDLVAFSRSALPSIIILSISAILILFHLLNSFSDTSHYSRQSSRSVASNVRWRYELASQITRVAAIVFLTLGAVHDAIDGLHLFIAAYAFVLGVLRLIFVRNLRWRHILLHHVNFTLSAQLLVLLAAYFFICAKIHDAECHHHPRSIIGATVSLTAAFLVAFNTPREWVPPQLEDKHFEGEKDATDEETCSWVSYYCTYSWITGIIWKGTMGILDSSGIPGLAWFDEPLYLLRKLQKSRSVASNTVWTILRYQSRELWLMAFWLCMAFICENFAPYGMYCLLNDIANPLDAKYESWVWLCLLFFGPISHSLVFQQYVWVSSGLVVRIKSAMTHELYVKALASMETEDDVFSEEDEGDKTAKTTSAGGLMNLMAADIDSVISAREVIQLLTGLPLGTVISMVGLYAMLGWTSIVGGVIIVASAPVSFWIGNLMYRSQLRVRIAQDSRISLVAEYLGSIRAIKYFAWEKPIVNKIVDSRAAEQKQLWRVSVLSVVLNQVTQIFPYIALLAMFALHIWVDGKQLNASTAFTSITLIKNVRRNIMLAGAFSRGFASAAVSLGRLDRFFDTAVPLAEFPHGPLRIEKALIRRNKRATFALQDISVDFVEGGLNVVTGQSGSGKSTLLLGILGEAYVQSGKLTKPGDIGYASQTAWLQNDTLKSNILFNSPFEAARYNNVITACCLDADLKEFSHGEQTIVGENGTSLSGGQRARVAIARALYSKAPLLLLDDVFSALDAKTAASLWKHCFCGDWLKGRTTVLVTQVPWIAEQADLSITLESGRIQSCEPNIGVVRKPVVIAKVLDDLGGDAGVGTQDGSPLPGEIQPNGDSINEIAKAAPEREVNDLVDQEVKASGHVSRWTILQYLGYFGSLAFVAFCILCLLLSNVASFVGTFWISLWVDAYERSETVSNSFYMGIFALIILLESGFYAIITLMFEWGAWRAGRRLHNDFIRSIMGVSLSFFKIVPVGRVVNRFSADIASIDGIISGMMRSAFDTLVLLIFRIAAVSSIMPVFMLPALLACAVGVVVGEMYTRTAVVLKRLTASSQSPVFSQFGDTLAGLAVIRARAGMASAFTDDLSVKLKIWGATVRANYNCNRWVSVRVDALAAAVSLSAGILAVAQRGSVAAGLVGFSLSNANGLSQAILHLVRSLNDLEVEMQSFHRIREYIKLEPEEKADESCEEEGAYTDDDAEVIPKLWPGTGAIEFRNVTIRYNPEGPNILTDINLKFKAGQRVAIIGRTGSGKSTLVLSLLRFTHIVTGQILFDGIDITHIPRRRLREALTIIPQEPVLFNGSVRTNLDPSGDVPQVVLEKALEYCHGIASFTDTSGSSTPIPAGLHGPLAESRGGAIHLDAEVTAHGENFSHGQRQVLSLCRALIRRSKLMLLDEATASMDYETDRGIQQILRQDLAEDSSDRTLITIAHRLRTIIDYDSIVVMSAGKVVEHASPKELYDAKGFFYDMVVHSGELDVLQGILEK